MSLWTGSGDRGTKKKTKNKRADKQNSDTEVELMIHIFKKNVKREHLV